MKKKFLLTLLPFMALTSCGASTPAGTYTFMLGKEGQPETQIGVTVSLTNDAFTYYDFKEVKDETLTTALLREYNVSTLAKGDVLKVLHDDEYQYLKDEKGEIIKDKDGNPIQSFYDFCFYEYTGDGAVNGFTSKGQKRPTIGDPQTMETIPDAKTFTAGLSIGKDMETMEPNIIACLEAGFRGYYYLPANKDDVMVDPKFGTRYNVGFFLDENSILGIEALLTYMNETNGKEASSAIRKGLSEIPSLIEEIVGQIDLSSYVFTTYCDNQSVTLKVPISLKDLQLQLAWYGYYIDMDPVMKGKVAAYDIDDYIKDPDKFKELIASFKFTNLLNVIDNQRRDEGAKVVMPGPRKEVRFGVLPTNEEVKKMNDLYSAYFSSTYTYGTSGDYLSKNGVITTLVNNDGTTTLCYSVMKHDDKPIFGQILPSVNPDMQPAAVGETIHTYLLTKELGSYKTFTPVDIKLSTGFDPNTNAVKITEIYKQGTTEPLSADLFYQEPFTFKGFHSLPISLTKNK